MDAALRSCGKYRASCANMCGVSVCGEIDVYKRQRTHLGAFRIEEPDGDDTTDVGQMELIVVPAMAYDRKGNRVGRGKGYYDRLLSSTKALKVGVAYDCQLVDEITAEATDAVSYTHLSLTLNCF